MAVDRVPISKRIDAIIITHERGRDNHFATKIGVSAVVAGKWRTGKSTPNEKNREKIAITYGINRMWLDGYDVPEVNPQPAAAVLDSTPVTPGQISVTGTIDTSELLRALQQAQQITIASQKDGAEKTATIGKLTDASVKITGTNEELVNTNAKLANTNAKLADNAIKITEDISGQLSFLRHLLGEKGDVFDPKGKASGRRSASGT